MGASDAAEKPLPVRYRPDVKSSNWIVNFFVRNDESRSFSKAGTCGGESFHRLAPKDTPRSTGGNSLCGAGFGHSRRSDLNFLASSVLAGLQARTTAIHCCSGDMGVRSIIEMAWRRPFGSMSIPRRWFGNAIVASTTRGCRFRSTGVGRKNDEQAPKLWGGRFTGKVDPLMEHFNASIGFDKRMWREDIEGSKAYSRALARAKIITQTESEMMQAGLDEVAKEWESGSFELIESDEDIHTANERRLTELIGPTAGKLHTGRSRNDQVATDLRLWLKKHIQEMQADLIQLLTTTVNRAESEIDILFPGYTHLQPAQPVRWSHWLMAYACMWQRDAQRLEDLSKRVDVMPLGSGAIAGHAFFSEEDRKLLAQDLGFSAPSTNSMDATSDRDFVAEFLFWASLTGVHFSRWSEDVIIYSSNEFRYIGLSDAYSTGSSLMPQKKNPDALELLRGKSGRNIGNMVTMLTVLKGLSMTYNKDLQEDKEPLFDTVDTMSGCIPIAAGVMATMTPKPENMEKRLDASMLATDLADYLVRKGVPFRETHHIAGQAVQLAEEQNKPMSKLDVDELRSLHDAFEDDVKLVWSFESSVESRNAEGSTSKRAVLEQVQKLKAWIKNYSAANPQIVNRGA